MAQSNSRTTSEITKEFTFEGDNATEEMTIQVSSSISMIGFQFMGEIEMGKLEVTIFDPNSKKEGGFELTSKKASKDKDKTSVSSSSKSNSNAENNTHSYSYTSTGSGKVHGNMSKHVDNPVSGTWKVIIKANNVKGQLAIKIGQQEG